MAVAGLTGVENVHHFRRIMARFYTRAEKRAYREKRQAQAKLVADRLMGKKKYIPPDASDFFGGTQMQSPFQYSGFGNMLNNTPRISSIISDVEGV